MGRIGDGDIHAAFVEFRAKESDKSVRAKNTSRQRAHLLECPAFLNAMKEHNPDNPILHEAVNGTPTQHTPAKTPKKRDLDTMISGFQGSTSSAPQTFPIPKPSLERDFQMSVQLNPKISVGPGIWGQRNWVSFISGHWNGRWGKGTVVPGGQDSQLIAPDLSTHIDANYLLQTHDHPPAFIAVKMDGWRVGPRDVLEKLEDPSQIDDVDPKTYSFRVYVHMETGDTRYLHLNTGMWIGSGVRRGTEGCITCKTKRLKCDETKPSCWQCHKRNVECGGYRKDFKWRAFVESTFTTRPIPSPNPSKATTRPWPMPSKSSASTRVSTAPANFPHQAVSLASDGSDPLDETGHAGLTSPHEACALCFGLSMSPDTQIPRHHRSAVPHQAAYGPSTQEDNEKDCQKLHDCLSMSTSPSLHHERQGEWSTLAKSAPSALSASTSSEIALPQVMSQHLPALDLLCARQPLNAFCPLAGEAQAQMEAQQDDNVEEIPRQANTAKDWQLRRLPPASSQTSPASEESTYFGSIWGFPRFSSRSPEMVLMRFDRQTCGILSVKDGPTENPWRTMIWPLAQDSPALYHAIGSMTAFHIARDHWKLRVEGVAHMRESIRYLSCGIEEGNIRLDAALATTLALAFSESWDRHISTGIQHLKGAKTMVNQALLEHRRNSLTPEEVRRLRFLCNTWVYMVVIARLTSVDDDESDEFDYALNAPINSLEAQHEMDPLMGCASTLFPLIGRVANLVRAVCKSAKNSINTIQQANELKNAVEAWEAPDFFEPPEDQSLNIQHSLDTAEAYRWATLLYLHQAVPEIPSRSSEELARKVIVYLLKVPLSSRAVIVQIYPLLAAGCEVTSSEDRAWVEGRWTAMMQRMLIGNLDKCWEVVKEVWKRRDTNASEGPRLVLRAENRRQSGGHGMPEQVQGECHFSKAGRKVQGICNALPMPPHVQRRRMSETIEDLDAERTVRGKMHWVGVMKDWQWEILLG
ncbi:MAG: hypothetical protein Q9206_003478 [Seirophora lacunosa]